MKIIIIILQAILNLVRKRRDLIANRSNINIPPEYRDDVVVWYSPTKQKLTNYDVIESYADDIRAKKDSIIEEANKELEVFKKFQIAAQANPKLTYVDFCNNIKNKEV